MVTYCILTGLLVYYIALWLVSPCGQQAFRKGNK